MSHAPRSWVLAASERTYRLLLFAYPPAYRRAYGQLMVQAYRDLCRDTVRRKGMAGLAALWFRILGDLATSAIAQHLEALREGAPTMTKKEHVLAIVAAVLPLALWAALALINPRFVRHMFVRSPAQPWGWIMVAGVFLLVGLAYFSQRKAFELTSQSGSSDQVPSRRILRGTLRAISVALFVLPAIVLVLFGPAAIMVLNME
ncbi:MAG: hypothetical protein AB8I80_08710 [Anaerolineae bacterium]